jgi:hypothetical protein
MRALFTSWMFWCGVAVGLTLNITLYLVAEVATTAMQGGRP